MLPIFVTTVGSKLYGISTENSDTDFRGFCLEDTDQLIGLKNFEQQQYSNGVEDGPSKIEGTIYSVRRYINLCFKGNPTVIEIAFANENFWMYYANIGKEICQYVRNHFLTKHLFKPYSSYHRAQIRKLQSMERTGKRAAEVLKYGWDLKFGSHAYRLARQCCIVMREGVLRPTLDPEDKQICLDIRAGKYNKEEALKLLDAVDKDMYEAYKVSSLPTEPDFNHANEFVVSIYERYLKGEVDYLQQNPFKPF